MCVLLATHAQVIPKCDLIRTEQCNTVVSSPLLVIEAWWKDIWWSLKGLHVFGVFIVYFTLVSSDLFYQISMPLDHTKCRSWQMFNNLTFKAKITPQKSLLAASQVWIFAVFLRLNWTSLGFGLLVGQKQSEDVTLALCNIFIWNFLTFYRQNDDWINGECQCLNCVSQFERCSVCLPCAAC